MKDFDINEYYDINRDTASVRGFFFLKDEDGNILRTNENMILKGGRSAIMKLFMNEFVSEYTSKKLPEGTSEELINEIKNISMKNNLYMRFGRDNQLSSPMDEHLKADIGKDDCQPKITSVYEELCISFNYTLSLDEATTIGEFGLAMKLPAVNAEASEIVIKDGKIEYGWSQFSRVVFPLIHLNSGSKYDVEYYIYF